MAPDPAHIRQTEQNTDALIAMLNHHRLKYAIEEKTDTRTHIRIRFTGNDLPMTLHIILRTDKQIATVLSAMPFKILPERRNDAALAVIAANHGLIDGFFDLNMETGELRFRLTSSYIESVLSEALFSYLMFVSAETIDRFNDRFEALNNGTLSLKDFVALDVKEEQAKAQTSG